MGDTPDSQSPLVSVPSGTTENHPCPFIQSQEAGVLFSMPWDLQSPHYTEKVIGNFVLSVAHEPTETILLH